MARRAHRLGAGGIADVANRRDRRLLDVLNLDGDAEEVSTLLDLFESCGLNRCDPGVLVKSLVAEARTLGRNRGEHPDDAAYLERHDFRAALRRAVDDEDEDDDGEEDEDFDAATEQLFELLDV